MPEDTEARVCPVMLRLVRANDSLGIARHACGYCPHCLRKRLIDHFNGREVLYHDAPPPWIELPKEIPPEAPPEEQKVVKSKKQQKNEERAQKHSILRGDLDDYLYKISFERSDGQLLYEIMKLKRKGKVAAREVLREIRKRAEAEKRGASGDGDSSASDALVNPKELLPWCPSPKMLFPHGVLSSLSQAQQSRFLAICQSVLNSGAIRFTQNIDELKDFLKKAAPERDYMGSLVLDMSEQNLENDDSSFKNHPLAWVTYGARDFVLKRWRKRWKCSEFPTVFASSFPVCTIDWSLHNLSSGPDSYPTLVATLRNGRHDRIQLPNLRHRCTLDVANLDTNFPLSSCDADRIFSEMSNIKELCLKNDVRVAMDATTACHLMSNSFVGHNYSYCIPIRVTEEMVHGTMTNITMMGKPRPLEAIEPCSTQRQIVKYLLKSTYVHKKEPASIPKDSRPKSSNGKPRDQSSYDPLDSILNSLDTLSSQSESSAGAAVSDNGRSYSIFSILGSRLLIRSRPAPLCAEGNQNLKGATLSFQPKMEYVPNAGATRLSDEEATWNYCKAIFKQSSNHALFRSHFMGTDVLQIQCWESQSFAVKSGSDLLWTGPTLKQEGRRMLSAYTTRFSRLLEELNHLSPGDYMLMNNNDGFIRVLPPANTQSENVFDASKVNVRIGSPSRRIHEAFYGLEPMIALQWQTVQSRAPGCYVAPDSKLKMIAMAQGGAKQNMKRTRNQRKRDTMKKKKLKNNKGNPQDSESTAERDHQDTRRPFGSNEEPSSPAGSDVSSQL